MTSPVVLEAETCLWPERCSSPIATSGSSLCAFKCLGPFHRSFHFDLEYSALLLSHVLTEPVLISLFFWDSKQQEYA